MKSILFLLTLACSMTANSQSKWEITLSKNSMKEHMGSWEQGDYKIYVDIEQMKSFFSATYQDYTNNILRCGEKDSSLVNYYRPTAKRYKDAANQLGEAKNDFDLRTIIVYHGIEDKNQNVGNSLVVRNYIKQLVERGTEIVIYKGERIFTLKCISELKDEGEILNRHYVIRTYFDDIENCIFTEYQHMGW